MKIKKLTSRWIHFALLLITGMVLTGSAKAQWVTYWDYLRNAGTATRTATIPTVVGNGTVTVGLTNSATGVTLPGVSVTMTNFSGGVQNGGTSGSAAAGSPAYATFNSFVDFSAGGIEVTTGSVALLINGLDPAKTYSFSGTSIRGNAPYTGRWTRCAITNVVSFTSAHTPGVVTTTVGGTVLGAHEAAYNCGINNTADGNKK